MKGGHGVLLAWSQDCPEVQQHMGVMFAGRRSGPEKPMPFLFHSHHFSSCITIHSPLSIVLLCGFQKKACVIISVLPNLERKKI